MRVEETRLFDRGRTVLGSVRVGKSRLFDRGLTKSMHCILHSRGFSTGVWLKLCIVLYLVRIGKSRDSTGV